MPRLYLPSPSFLNNQISIGGEKARYLTAVLRCRKGDSLTIFNGEGSCFRTILTRVDRKTVTAELKEKSSFSPESPIHLILVQGILKGEKMDIVVQKTTELGVKEIMTVITERSQLRETGKVDRWRRIAEEASRQSGRNVVPVVHEPIAFSEFINLSGGNDARAIRGRGDPGTQGQGEIKGFIFWEETGLPIRDALQQLSPAPHLPFTVSPIHVIVGPEGGFTQEEIAFAKNRGLLATSLGRRILRAETAAISAVTLMQFLFGDL